MKKFITFLQEESCPTATQDVHVNVENRQHAIDEYFYGPANPEKPGSYWKEAAKRWKVDEKTAMSMRCYNCAAFDVSDKMRKCIESGIQGDEEGVDAMASIEKSNLGYCNFLHFKCAGSRSCSIWITGGAIENEDRTQ